MRPFPHLQIEQDNLIELSSQHREYLSDSEKVSNVVEICPPTTNISDGRIEIVYPHCVGFAPQRLVDELIAAIASATTSGAKW